MSGLVDVGLHTGLNAGPGAGSDAGLRTGSNAGPDPGSAPRTLLAMPLLLPLRHCPSGIRRMALPPPHTCPYPLDHPIPDPNAPVDILPH